MATFSPYLTLPECAFFLWRDRAPESFPKGSYLCSSFKDGTEIVPSSQNPAVDGDYSVVRVCTLTCLRAVL